MSHDSQKRTWVGRCIRKDLLCNKEHASEQKCSSQHAADSVAKVSGVRYSELSRLPYFNTVDNFLIDPMHNLFLGLVDDLGNAIIEGVPDSLTAMGETYFKRE